MKNAIVITVGSVVSFLTLLMIGLGLAALKPEWFNGASQTPAGTATAKKVDSTAASAAQVSTDSLRVDSALAQVKPPSSKTDSLLVTQLSEKAKNLETQVDSLKCQLVQKAKPDSVPVQDWKSSAKLIESMSAEEATKILRQMPDTEVKQVLAKVKKRQAGKILAILDPERAAKLLR